MNFPLPWLCVEMASIMVSWHTCYKLVSQQNFCGVGSFMEAILSCLNLKPVDRFLTYSMPEVFNKIEPGLTVIMSAWAEFKPVLLPKFFRYNGTYIYWVLE